MEEDLKQFQAKRESRVQIEKNKNEQRLSKREIIRIENKCTIRERLQIEKDKYDQECDELLKHGVAECFDICSIAHFKSILDNPEETRFGNPEALRSMRKGDRVRALEDF